MLLIGSFKNERLPNSDPFCCPNRFTLFSLFLGNVIMEYIKSIETVNTGGGCMVDLIHLQDGRVIGLNDECVVLYGSIADFWAGGSNNLPAFLIPSIVKA